MCVFVRKNGKRTDYSPVWIIAEQSPDKRVGEEFRENAQVQRKVMLASKRGNDSRREMIFIL